MSGDFEPVGDALLGVALLLIFLVAAILVWSVIGA